jgi:hypothetical protein
LICAFLTHTKHNLSMKSLINPFTHFVMCLPTLLCLDISVRCLLHSSLCILFFCDTILCCLCSTVWFVECFCEMCTVLVKSKFLSDLSNSSSSKR